MRQITNFEDYQIALHSNNPTKMNKNLEIALDVRKFEIDLYWKRASYFWTFISVIFTGYFALDFAKIPNILEIKLLLSFIGLIFSLAWYLVNRGNKYWQENWEAHVVLLENENIGGLFKTILSKEYYPKWKFLGAYPFSLSKINQVVSLLILFVWIFLYCDTLGILLYVVFDFKILIFIDSKIKSIIIFMALAWFLYLLSRCVTKNEGPFKNLKFYQREISDFINE